MEKGEGFAVLKRRRLAPSSEREASQGLKGPEAESAGQDQELKGASNDTAPAQQSMRVFVLDIQETGGLVMLYGCTTERSSVAVRVAGFRYSFYIEVARKATLSAEDKKQLRARAGGVEFSLEAVKKISLVGYRREAYRDMFKVTLTSASTKGASKVVSAFNTVFGEAAVTVYERDADAVTQFSLDTGVRCGGWLEISSPLPLPTTASHRRTSHCATELDCTYHADSHTFTLSHGSSTTTTAANGRVQHTPQTPATPRARTHTPPHTHDGDSASVAVHAFDEDTTWGALPPLKLMSVSITRAHVGPMSDTQASSSSPSSAAAAGGAGTSSTIGASSASSSAAAATTSSAPRRGSRGRGAGRGGRGGRGGRTTASSSNGSAKPSTSLKRRRADDDDGGGGGGGGGLEEAVPVRMIGVTFTYDGGSGTRHSRRRFVLINTSGLAARNTDHKGDDDGTVAKACGPCVVRAYTTERDLLQAFQDLILAEDPDVVCGFEVGENLRVLLDRASKLRMKDYGTLSRVAGQVIVVKTMQTYSARWAKTKTRISATSNQEGTEVQCPGCVVLDVMRVMHMEEALRLYTLGEIAIEVLGKTFETLTDEQTHALLSTSEGWMRGVMGGVAPADLALDVVFRKNAVSEMVELSRVTGMPLGLVYIRGQMARVMSLLQMHTTRRDIVIPTSTQGMLDKSALNQSALVLDPMPRSDDNPEGIGTQGIHRQPVAILDFTSLYPSLMIHYNICYTTLINDPSQMPSDEACTTTPTGEKFVNHEVREGVVPRLLADLLEARKRAVATARSESTGEAHKRVLDARQRAFKLCANAMYGFTGASVNSLYAREIADSVLALGRATLSRAIAYVEEKHPELKVVYGDTDSLFVEYVPSRFDLAAAMDHSKNTLAEGLNALLPPRIQVKHERVFYPMLLQHARRYAGIEWSGPNERKGLVIKGMEAVQRNSMPYLVTTMKRTLCLLLEDPDDLSTTKEYLRSAVNDLLLAKPDLYSLTWTRGLWRLGEYDSKQPHVALMERLEKEGGAGGRVFRVGERVPYVFVQKGANTPLYQKAELPAIALEKNMAIDIDEYIKQLRMPMVRVLTLGMPEAEALKLFEPSFRAAQSEAAPRGLVKFFGRSQARCIGCKSPIASNGTSSSTMLCADCASVPVRSLVPAIDAYDSAMREYGRMYAQCGGCQRGSRTWDVVCKNDSCPVYYRRVKAERQAGDADSRLQDLLHALDKAC